MIYKLDDIKTMTREVTNSELAALRLEEEILLNAVKASKVSLKSKTESLQRIARINKRQLEILGEKLA